MSLKRFKLDQTGQVAVIFAFSLVPLFATAGFCLDYQTKLQRTQKVQAVLDSAVLAAARVKQTGASDTDVKTALINFLTPQIAQIPGLTCTAPTVTFSATGEQIESDIECKQDTSLMGMVGHETMQFTVDSASNYALGKVDIAFMFDLSDSMRYENRLDDLEIAAEEAIDILLPSGAPDAVIENTRIAMASFGSSLNAGTYFETVTGVPATRTYQDTLQTRLNSSDAKRGTRINDMLIRLYDADRDTTISRIGQGAIIEVSSSQLDNMTIAIDLNGSHSLFDNLESIHLELSGEVSAAKEENVSLYSLYGDVGSDLIGKAWTSGAYKLRIRAYDEDSLRGREIYDEEIEFELFVDGDMSESILEHTITSTCIWERNGVEKFSDAPPGPGQYFSHERAWFVPNGALHTGGTWDTGFFEDGIGKDNRYGCDLPQPLELTNDRRKLTSYLPSIARIGHNTAGHLGVAWTWYLISDQWSAVFDGTAKPASFGDPEYTKAVVLMTDGEFNQTGFDSQGDSATQAREICDNMKLKHVQIYSVAFKAPPAGNEVLQYCASNPGFFYNANNGTELKQAYKEIAVSLSALRLSK